MPIQHCLIASLRRIKLSHLFGKASIIALSVIVTHGLSLLRCLTSSAIAIASTQFVPGGFVSGRGSDHPGVADGAGPSPVRTGPPHARPAGLGTCPWATMSFTAAVG